MTSRRFRDTISIGIQNLAVALGWRRLTLHTHVLTSIYKGHMVSRTSRFYCSEGKADLLLHINESPLLSASVYSVKFDIWSGWMLIDMDQDGNCTPPEIERLGDYLNYKNFATPAARRRFRKRHPELVRHAATSLHDDGMPFKLPLI